MQSAQLGDIVAAASGQERVNVYCIFAAIVVLVYDYILTLEREISLFWLKPRLTSASVIYALARTIALAYVVVGLLGDAVSWTTPRCKGEMLASDILVLLSYTTWAVMSAFRVYALAQRRYSLALLILLLGLVPVAMNAATMSTSTTDVMVIGQYTFCQQSNSKDLALTDRYVLLVAPACAVVSDLVVVVLTFYHVRPPTFRRWWARSTSRRGLSQVVLRDGALYFVILTALNAIQFIIYVTEPTGFLDSFMAPLILVFVPRFMLDLQESSARVAVHGSDVFEMSSYERESTTAVYERTILQFECT